MDTTTTTAPELTAEQHARRHYRADHFTDQVTAERAYFRILAEWLARGRLVDNLQRRVASLRHGYRLARARRAIRMTELTIQWDKEAARLDALRRSGTAPQLEAETVYALCSAQLTEWLKQVR